MSFNQTNKQTNKASYKTQRHCKPRSHQHGQQKKQQCESRESLRSVWTLGWPGESSTLLLGRSSPSLLPLSFIFSFIFPSFLLSPYLRTLMSPFLSFPSPFSHFPSFIKDNSSVPFPFSFLLTPSPSPQLLLPLFKIMTPPSPSLSPFFLSFPQSFPSSYLPYLTPLPYLIFLLNPFPFPPFPSIPSSRFLPSPSFLFLPLVHFPFPPPFTPLFPSLTPPYYPPLIFTHK